MHSTIIKVIVCGLVVTSLLSSCRKEPLELENPNTTFCTSYVHQFQTVWEGINHNYVLWERDTIDWDARYAKFLPIFQNFDARGASNPVDSAEYRQAWFDLTKGFLDHHMLIVLYNPNGKYKIALRPGSNSYNHVTDIKSQIAALKSLPGVTEYVDSYSDDNQFVNSVFCLLPGKTQGKHIAYFRFSEFAVSEMADSLYAGKETVEAPFRAFYGNDFQHGITDGAAARNDVESIIIDLRGNPGGNVADVSGVIGSLLQQDFHFGYTRYKQGLGRLDYTGWNRLEIPLPQNHLQNSKPIVVLADINTVSCGEIGTQTLKSQPNAIMIGERTYGATCALVPHTETYYSFFFSGCFGDKNLVSSLGTGKPTNPDLFEHYVYSGTYDVVTTDYKSLEGVGVQPDIEVKYDADALKAGVDTQLNRALQFLRTGK